MVHCAPRARRIPTPEALVLAILFGIPLAAGAEEPVDLGKIEVIATTPLPGLGTPLEQVPSNVQTFDSRDLARQRTGGVGEFLNYNANSVSISSPTANPR